MNSVKTKTVEDVDFELAMYRFLKKKKNKVTVVPYKKSRKEERALRTGVKQ